MLILTRRPGQVLEIHMPQGVVKIVVLQVDGWGGLHKIGIQAPKEVMILKEELKGKPLHFAKANRPGRPAKPD